MELEDLLKLKIAHNHIIENTLDSEDFNILDKWGLIENKNINGVYYVLYPSNEDAKELIKQIEK